MNGNPITGAAYILRGLKLIQHPRLRHFVLIPLLVNVAVFGLLAWLAATQFQALLDWLLPASESWDFLRWLLWPLFALALLLVSFYTFTVVANLIAAPFNSLLAKKVEQLLAGNPITENDEGLLRELAASLGSELRKLGYFLLRAVPLLLLFLIPVLNAAAPFLWLFFSAWFLALEYGDYPMANNGLGFTEQLARLKKVRLTSLGFGGALTLMMMIPLLNFVAMPTAVAGATALWHERLKEGGNLAEAKQGRGEREER